MGRAISSLGALPGRKVMILLNSGIYLGPNMAEVLQAIRSMSDAANRASPSNLSIFADCRLEQACPATGQTLRNYTRR
jgi:hypothetical protein